MQILSIMIAKIYYFLFKGILGRYPDNAKKQKERSAMAELGNMKKWG